MTGISGEFLLRDVPMRTERTSEGKGFFISAAFQVTLVAPFTLSRISPVYIAQMTLVCPIQSLDQPVWVPKNSG
jgi:hypothetical protein